MKRTRTAAPASDRLPPHSVETEAGALACVLLEPRECLDTCGEMGVSGEWFYDLRHQVIWAALWQMHEAATTIDPVLVYQWLTDRGQIADAGGLEYVTSLPDQVGSAAQLPGYLEVLRDKWLLRSVVRTGTGLVVDAYSIEEGEKTDPGSLVARAEREILRLSEAGQQASEERIKEILRAVIDDLEEYHRGHAQVRGLTTGLDYVDKMLCGLGGENGNFIVISGRPSTGKTALAMQIADHVALEHVWWDPVLAAGPDGRLAPVKEVVNGVERLKAERKVGLPVGIFSLEMSKKGLVRRMLFRRARADVQRWRTGFAVAEDFQKLALAAPKLIEGDRIIIEDEGVYVFESLKAKARRWVRQYGCKLFVVDYFQLLESGERRLREDRVRELGEISKGFQRLGKELNVPFIIIAQMNRDYEKEPNRKPRLSDLKDCGQLEQDADVVGFLYEPKMKAEDQEELREEMSKVYGKLDWTQCPRRVDLLLAKARNGPTGDCQLLFQKSCTHFMDYNVWRKEHGLKSPAKGEKKMPTSAELGLEESE